MLRLPVYCFIPLPGFRRCGLLLIGLFGAVLLSAEVTALTFDLEAFAGGLATAADISRFNTRNTLAPGTYRVDVLLNGQPMGRREITFVTLNDEDGAQPCVTRELLEALAVDTDKLQAPDDSHCRDFPHWIPLATSHFDAGTLQVTATVPQVYMRRFVRGYVDPAHWDNGIDAGLLNYTFSGSKATAGNAEDRGYLGLNGGLNLGDWRLRHQGAQNWSSRSGLQRYQQTATYVQRSLTSWQSQLTLGDSFSSGQILDGVRVRGITLATDDRMLAQSRQGYAPQVRGIADSNAMVTVSQNGYTIYETTVAPGPFVITDLYPTGYGGDLDVSVTEVDGRRTQFVVPYSVAPQLLRYNATRYSATLGQVQQRGVNSASPSLFQGTLQHGLSDHLTLYGGTTLAEGYTQGKLGMAMSTPYGALSLDSTGSRTRVPGQGVMTGRSVGLAYNKNLPTSGTHFVLGAYRFSTEGYLGLFDALNVRELGRQGGDTYGYARQKSRLDMTVSQKLWSGTLSLYGSSVDYWGGQQGRQTSFTLSYGASWKQLNWNLSAQRSRTRDVSQLNDRDHSDAVFYGRTAQPGRVDNRLVLTLSMPLGRATNAPSLTGSLSRETGDSKGSQQQLGLNGLLGERGQGNYGIYGSHGSGASTNVNVYAGYRANAANLRAGFGQSSNTSQLSMSADGALVAHSGGVTLAHNLGEASALVHAPGAQGASLGSGGGARIDSGGYAVMPSLRAFHNNDVAIDPEGMSMDVELTDTRRTVAPTLGAVTLVTFATVSGRAVVVKALREGDQPLPFAAQVFDEQGREVGVVGQGGKAFVRGIAEHGALTVKWSETAAGRCRIEYVLPAQVPSLRQQDADLLAGRCIADMGAYKVTTR